jgi:dihydrofolate reductase
LLASRGYRRVWLMGGGKLASSFHAEHLIARYIISVVPILLGSGIPVLAPRASAPDTLRFVSATPFKGGIVQLTYEHAQNA